ncbi:MAG: hypothetical protein LUH05_04455 [Candidatus Gastranaerophilales bacterium]|nr:hypothetical protein [Candidatus Gastranaerophilales bacterium]
MEIQSQKNINDLNIQSNEVKQQQKINLEQKSDEVLLSSNINKKAENKKTAAKVLLALGIITAAGIAIYKGRQIKALKEIPADLKPLFNDLKGKNGKEFVDDAYSGIVKHMGLSDVAPKNVNLTNKADGMFNTVTGGFHPIENTIEYSKGFIDKLSKKQQFNLLSHELKHCEQYNKILRTEGLGAEALAKANAEQAVYQASGLFGNFSENVMKQYPKEEAEKIIKDEIDKLTQEYSAKIKKNFSESLKLPKIPASSQDGVKAKEYLESVRKYKGLGWLGTASKEYLENILEKEAYGFGGKMGKWFEASTSFPDKIKDFFRILKNT